MENSERATIAWTPSELLILKKMDLNFDPEKPLDDDQLYILYEKIPHYFSYDSDGNPRGTGQTAENIQDKLIAVLEPRGFV